MNKYLLDTYSTPERKIVDLTKLSMENALVIGRYRYNEAHNSLDDHYHQDMIEICYCHKGNQVYEVGNKSYHIKGGDVFVVYPNEIHSTGAQPEEKGVLYWILIHIPKNKRFFHYPENEGLVFINALLNLPQRHFKGSIDMRKTLETIMEVSETDMQLQSIILENLIISFLIQVLNCAGSYSAKSLKSENAEKIEKFIGSHFKNPLSIEQMAGVLNLSESRFKSWFKLEFGIPPLEFILKRRVVEAKVMLKTKSTSISNIAYDLGFCSPQHFATTFKRYTNLSPKDFRDNPQI